MPGVRRAGIGNRESHISLLASHLEDLAKLEIMPFVQVFKQGRKATSLGSVPSFPDSWRKMPPNRREVLRLTPR